jgi:hypothetical protein
MRLSLPLNPLPLNRLPLNPSSTICGAIAHSFNLHLKGMLPELPDCLLVKRPDF